MDANLVGVMLSQLTAFATELGKMRAEITSQQANLNELIQQYKALESMCRKVENSLMDLAGELRGRGAIEDRPQFHLTQVHDQGTLVMRNDGQVSVKQAGDP